MIKKNKKIIIGIVLASVLVFGFYQIFIKKEKEETMSLGEVSLGQVFQAITETGIVSAKKEINLNFNRIGTIDKIYTTVGDEVRAGQKLVKLDTSQLEIQLTEATAFLSLKQAMLGQLIAGVSDEDIRLAETAVSNSETALQSAEQNLININSIAENNLNQSYESALNLLSATYLKLQNTFNIVNGIQRKYFTKGDQEGFSVRENKEKIENAMNTVALFAQNDKNASHKEIDIALIEARSAIALTANSLDAIKDITETHAYRNKVSATEKALLDTEKTTINTASLSIANSQRVISSTKLTNQASINTAQTRKFSMQGQLKSAKNVLDIKKAGPRKTDIDVYNAQIAQAKSRIRLLDKQIRESTLISPIDGVVAHINRKTGEISQAPSPVISVVSSGDFQIEAFIYEEDVVKIATGDLVDVVFVAFPDETFRGKIVSINPTEKLIDRVVYYEITIGALEGLPAEIKPGMSVDIAIKTALRENVLIVPEDAISRIDGQYVVRVFKDGEIKERKIEIGLEGDNNMVEIISGLEEGEKIVKK